MAEFRHYSEGDYDTVCEFFVRMNAEDRTHINWNWARFEWMMWHPEFDKSSSGSFGLWTEDGRVVAAAVYDMYFGEAFCGVLPGYDHLYPEVLDYAYRELKDDAGLGIALCDGYDREAAELLNAGFVPAEQTETVMRLELDRVLKADLPDGLRFTEPDPPKESVALQWLFWQGFDHGEDRMEFEKTIDWEKRDRIHFNRDLNVAAIDGEDRFVAYCCVWYLRDTDYAYVEPVCTIPSWRGKGVGKAVVYEALNRAASMGAKRAYVISDQKFYEKLGFVKDTHYTFFWKKEDH